MENHFDQPPPGKPERAKRPTSPTFQELQSHETGQELYGFYQRVDQLQVDLDEARDRHLKDPDEANAPLGIEPPLTERYRTADNLLRAVKAVLSDGTGGGTPLLDNTTYLQEKIGNAIAQFGLKIVPDENPLRRQQAVQRRAVRRLERLADTTRNRIVPNDDPHNP